MVSVRARLRTILWDTRTRGGAVGTQTFADTVERLTIPTALVTIRKLRGRFQMQSGPHLFPKVWKALAVRLPWCRTVTGIFAEQKCSPSARYKTRHFPLWYTLKNLRCQDPSLFLWGSTQKTVGMTRFSLFLFFQAVCSLRPCTNGSCFRILCTTRRKRKRSFSENLQIHRNRKTSIE